jgi:callose synthase
MKSGADHQDKRNYDDFNEFFWSRNCLMYRYSSDDLPANDVEGFGLTGALPGEALPPVTEVLRRHPRHSWRSGRGCEASLR